MNPAKTFTGTFPIGIRRVGSAWQRSIEPLGRWALENGFGFVDLGRDAVPEDLKGLRALGLQAGTVDLLDWNGFLAMTNPDARSREAIIQKTIEHIEASSAGGASLFFTVTIPANPLLPRKENFGYTIESYRALVPVLERTGSRIVIEGWPGPGAVCCTPETYRAFFRELPSERIGINYDPSHLLRMGIDPLRFLNEFAGRVFHVHGKDTALYSESLYEFGHELPGTFASPHQWGGHVWRYTIPGHGESRWVEIFRILEDAHYNGLVGIELEDENFNGTEQGEKRGFIKSREFLEGC